MPKQTRAELEGHLRDKLNSLLAHGRVFDQGLRSEAKTLATDVRVIVHDTDSSTSLLTHLGIKASTRFFATPGARADGGCWSQLTRSIMFVGPSGPTFRFDAFLDDFPKSDPTDLVREIARRTNSGQVVPGQVYQGPKSKKLDWVLMSFDDWWGQEILWADSGESLTRGDLVKDMANKDGGAHVDAKLRAVYAAFSRGNALGFRMTTMDAAGEHVSTSVPSEGPEFGCMRQIAYELQRTLEPVVAGL